MKTLTCGELTIPLGFITSASWARQARTVARKDGSVSVRGYETSEVTVQAVFSPSLCVANELDVQKYWSLFDSLAPSMKDEPAQLFMGGVPILPSLLFALTSVNITRVGDASGSYELGIDMTFAGVAVAKESARNRAIDFSEADVTEIPAIKLGVDGIDTTIDLRERYALSECVQREDSLAVTLEVGDDRDLTSESAYLQSLVERHGFMDAYYSTGQIRYFIADAALVGSTLSITGSVLPPECQKVITKTYFSTPLVTILTELCSMMNVKCHVNCTLVVEHFIARGRIIDAIAELEASFGLIRAYNGNAITFTVVPRDVVATETLTDTQSTDTAPAMTRGVVWQDGLESFSAGVIDSDALHVQSRATCSAAAVAQTVLARKRYDERIVVARQPVDQRYIQGSPVKVLVNDRELTGMVRSFERDFIEGIDRLEVSILK